MSYKQAYSAFQNLRSYLLCSQAKDLYRLLRNVESELFKVGSNSLVQSQIFITCYVQMHILVSCARGTCYVHVRFSMSSYTLKSVVRGHHVYKSCWMPAIGQILKVHQEVGNTYDCFAVRTSRGGSTVT